MGKTPNTVFGDPCDFAIEAGIEPELTPPSSPWGHMCVWCCGIALGDVEDLCCGIPADIFEELAESVDELWDESLEGLDDLATWNFLDGLLYGYHGDVEIEDSRTLEQIHIDVHRYGKFDFLTNWDEPFDGYKSFILCRPGSETVRILCRKFPASVGLGVDVTKAGLIDAIRAFVKWYREQARRLSQRESGSGIK